MSNVVGERFQITIDKRVREELGIKPGDRAVEWVEDGRLVVGFIPGANESMLGILKRITKAPIEPITDWQALKDRAWEARAAEIARTLTEDSERHRADSETDAT
jgi:AbrB family looped-hinge helix DNA binding protein